jgi:hypothetical protein
MHIEFVWLNILSGNSPAGKYPFIEYIDDLWIFSQRNALHLIYAHCEGNIQR